MASDWVFGFYPENQFSQTKAVMRVWYKGVEIHGVESPRSYEDKPRFKPKEVGFSMDIVLGSSNWSEHELKDGELPPGIVPEP